MGRCSSFAIFAFLPLLAGGACGHAAAADHAESAAPPAESAPAVVMSVADCRRLLARLAAGSGDILHRPVPGVEYKPGQDVDSQGRPIAPADLPGSGAAALPLDQMLTLDIKIPLSSLVTNAPDKVKDSELHVTTVRVDPLTGQLSFNGRTLEGTPEDAVAAACRKRLQQPAGR